MRQKFRFVRLENLASAVSWRCPHLVSWIAGHELFQLTFDLRPIPIAQRLPRISMSPALRLSVFARRIRTH